MTNKTELTWKEATAIRILLIVAKFLAEDSELAEEIKTLKLHIQAWSR